MTKRKLTSKEKEIYDHVLVNLDVRNKILTSKNKYYTLMLDELLEQQFIEKRQELKGQQKTLLDELEENKRQIETLNKHKKEGVEIKNGK